MKIESTAFGAQFSDPETRILFPLGIPGFEENRTFQLFHQDAGDVVGYLQSLDDPDLAFSVFAPESLNIFYEFPLTDDELALLKLERAEDVVLLLIAYRGLAGEDSPEQQAAKVNVNFMAPLVINSQTRLGLQKVLYRTERQITIKAS
ncbi:flagellar assembly protein FliW [Sedimenticola sp.]|uniref:flagellar assembly protein FliW n=1 Tax=Sedimenticola sp. TaxID=1940285 RepID=UPI003D13FEED